jgi:hypothetical protein
MAYYQQRGSVPPKRHTQHRAPDGSLYFEELMGEEGFVSDSSLLYHGAESFDELAVMVDTFRPLRLGEGSQAVDDQVYAWSWSRNETGTQS